MYKWIKRFSWFVGTGFLVFLTIYNLKYNQYFLDASLISIITVSIAVFIAYYFTQRRNDERKRKEKVEDIIEKIQAFANSGEATFRDDTPFDKKIFLVKQRRISNKIKLLQEIKKTSKIEKEADLIKKHFDNYKAFIGEYIDNIEYLYEEEAFCFLQRELMLIDDRCDEIKIGLYK